MEQNSKGQPAVDLPSIIKMSLVAHYGVTPFELEQALLHRPLALINGLTEWDKPGGPAAFETMLKKQSVIEYEWAQRGLATIGKAKSAIAAATRIHEEIARLIAELRAQHQGEPAK